MTESFKILEVIIKNRHSDFDTIQAELMKNYPELYWEDLQEYLYFLKQNGFISILVGDDTIIDIKLQPTARVRLEELQAAEKDEKLKRFFGTLAGLFKVSL